MKRKKKDSNLLMFLFIIAFAGLLWYGGDKGWFKSIVNVSGGGVTILNTSPSLQSPSYTTCSQVCSAQGFSKNYNFVSECRGGEMKVVYGYPGQNPLLTCCCYNEEVSSGTCVDSDGNNALTPGFVTAGSSFYDDCAGNWAVKEYYCNGNSVAERIVACGAGSICFETRGGDYCKSTSSTWNAGDTIFQGSGSGSLIGGTSGFGELDLADYGITTDGTCRLGAQIQSSWNYGNSFCTGVQGQEGVVWNFFDSNGLEYSRTDLNPVGLGVDLHPEEHILEWDGSTNWHASLVKILNLPNCVINYEYTIKIYIYDC